MIVATNSDLFDGPGGWLTLCDNDDQRESIRRRFVRIKFMHPARDAPGGADVTLLQQMLDGEMAGIWATWTRTAHNLRAHMGERPLSGCGCGMEFGGGGGGGGARAPPVDVLLSRLVRAGATDTLWLRRDIAYGLGPQVLDATGLRNVQALTVPAWRRAMAAHGTGQIAEGARRNNATNRGAWGASLPPPPSAASAFLPPLN